MLLHDVGLDVVGFISLSLLPLGNFQVLGFLDFQVALRFGLLSHGERLRQHSFLIRVRLCYGSFALCQRTLYGSVAVSFGGGHVGIALDSGHVRLAHVGDVLVLVAHFLDGERDHLQAHLVHVIGAGRSHAVGHHLGLFHDFFHRELADDAAQVPLHH